MLTQDQACYAIDNTLDELSPGLKKAEERLAAMLKEIGELDHNNVYLFGDTMESLVFVKNLRRSLVSLRKAVDTVSWRD